MGNIYWQIMKYKIYKGNDALSKYKIVIFQLLPGKKVVLPTIWLEGWAWTKWRKTRLVTVLFSILSELWLYWMLIINFQENVPLYARFKNKLTHVSLSCKIWKRRELGITPIWVTVDKCLLDWTWQFNVVRGGISHKILKLFFVINIMSMCIFTVIANSFYHGRHQSSVLWNKDLARKW